VTLARVISLAIALIVALGAAPMDSQLVLQRYALALDGAAIPKDAIFSYTLSQAGPTNIEQRHRIYRSGIDVRDETLAIDGLALKTKITQIGRREDRYAIARTAPRASAYGFVFVRTMSRDGSLDYVYDVIPLVRASVGFTVTHVTIDGSTFLPRIIAFHTSNGVSGGDGELQYAAFGKYWMPVAAAVTATVNGKPARERIAFSDYRFPASLPPSTFSTAKPLPQATLPP
jgi:hypothetical protein